jgi:hypothetical protein
MPEIAGWIAPAATMIAAMMTAANLRARVTGYGFVLFSVGAVAWMIVALASGQQNLLWSNAFLLLVDVIGIWRWLGRQAKYEAGADAAAAASGARPGPDLFALGTLAGRPIEGPGHATVGRIVDAMAECERGTIAYLVVSTGGVGGVGERLHALSWREVALDGDLITTPISAAALGQRPQLDPEHWPATARAAGIVPEGAFPQRPKSVMEKPATAGF